MRLLIVFDTYRGHTRRVMRALAEALPDAQVCDLRRMEPVSPVDFDRIILGGPVYLGKLTRRLSEYMRQYGEVLVKRELGIFLSCLLLDSAARQMQENFPPAIFAAAQCRAFIGGRLDSPVGRVVAKLVDDEPLITGEIARASLQQLIDFGGKP